jgi:ankyrin repeat protein
MKNSQRRFLVLPPSKNFSTHRALLNAVSNDSRESVDLILDDDKSNLNGFDSVGQNPLLFAIEGEKFEAASALVKQGASITICDANGENAVMKLVTYASAKVGAIDSRSLTKEFREEALKPFRDLFVVDTSVELDGLSLTRAICKKDKAGKTIYDLATDEGVRDECRDMVRRQFDMVFQDSLREPLRMRLKAMKLLIETHGELLDSDRLFGRDPISPNYLRRALLHSSAHGSNEVVKVILDSGKVDINYQPQLTDVVPGPTALMSAAVEGQLATVKMLCSRGAKVVAVGSLEEGKNLKTARQHVIEKINQLKAAGQETDSYGEIEKYLSEYAARKVSRRASVELMERNELLEALVAEKEKEIKKLKDPVPAD